MNMFIGCVHPTGIEQVHSNCLIYSNEDFKRFFTILKNDYDRSQEHVANLIRKNDFDFIKMPMNFPSINYVTEQT